MADLRRLAVRNLAAALALMSLALAYPAVVLFVLAAAAGLACTAVATCELVIAQRMSSE